MTRECFIVLSIIMISQYDDLSGKDADVQNFLKMIKEKNSEKGMEGMLERMSPTGKKADNFLRENRPTSLDFMGGPQQPPVEFMGGPKMAHDYHDDPELIKTLQEIINTPGYDPDSVREAQRQMIRINAGLPRFPKA